MFFKKLYRGNAGLHSSGNVPSWPPVDYTQPQDTAGLGPFATAAPSAAGSWRMHLLGGAHAPAGPPAPGPSWTPHTSAPQNGPEESFLWFNELDQLDACRLLWLGQQRFDVAELVCCVVANGWLHPLSNEPMGFAERLTVLNQAQEVVRTRPELLGRAFADQVTMLAAELESPLSAPMVICLNSLQLGLGEQQRLGARGVPQVDLPLEMSKFRNAYDAQPLRQRNVVGRLQTPQGYGNLDSLLQEVGRPLQRGAAAAAQLQAARTMQGLLRALHQKELAGLSD
jgi:hypothetical protein